MPGPATGAIPATDVSPVRRGGADGGDLRTTLPAITIVWHHDLRRVGESAPLRRGPREVSRHTAPFDLMTDTALSAQVPFLIVDYEDGNAVLRPGGASRTSVAVDGSPLVEPLLIPSDRLRRGVILTLADRIVVCLHHRRTPTLPGRSSLGLVGTSDVMESIRKQIRQVADLDIPVLIRGPSGTGKELVAQAIADSSKAPSPFVSYNMANLTPSMADAELFGHEKGAFTGAVDARPGLFGEADGGTLFLDEIAAASVDVHRKLLRAVDTQGQIRPVGSKRARVVKVRLLTATDADLEEAVRRGTFDHALFYRLKRYQITLPALADRREDIGSLFLHFLRELLAATGELDRLEPRDPKETPWLAATDVARIAAATFAGNLRGLRSIADRLVISARGQPFAHLDDAVEALLRGAELPAGAVPTQATKAGRPTDEQIRDALLRNNYVRTAAAKDLGIHRDTIYERLKANPTLWRSAEALSDTQILKANEVHHGDIAKMAVQLQVAPKPLKKRLSELLRRRR